jgi:hypothetical protein
MTNRSHESDSSPDEIQSTYEAKSRAAKKYDWQNERGDGASEQTARELSDANQAYLDAVNRDRIAQGLKPFANITEEGLARIKGEAPGGFPRKFD